MDDDVDRQIRQLRDDFREDLVELKTAQTGLLPREVWAARRDADVHRIAALEQALLAAEGRRSAEQAAMEAQHSAALAAVDSKYADAVKSLSDQVAALERERIGRLRWLISTVVIPIAAILAGAWFALRSK